MERKIEGTVGHGKELGRTIGFPTANIITDLAFDEELEGVWACWAETEGQRFPCIVNVGRHPTFPEGPATVEAHLIGFEGDLYGKKMEVAPVCFLRGQTRFESGDELARQLNRDRKNALQFLTGDADREDSDVRTL